VLKAGWASLQIFQNHGSPLFLFLTGLNHLHVLEDMLDWQDCSSPPGGSFFEGILETCALVCQGSTCNTDLIYLPLCVTSCTHGQGSGMQEPESIDKEFLRLWFRDNCDPYKDAALPEAPHDLVAELSARYVYLYEVITGEVFQLPDLSTPAHCRIEASLRKIGAP
jgi:hypothetical protein